MRDELLVVLATVVVFAMCVINYSIGYDQGRNDGFHAGWREATGAKELPEPPTEDE